MKSAAFARRAAWLQGEPGAEQCGDGQLHHQRRDRDDRLYDDVVDHGSDHRAVLEHSIDAVAGGRAGVESQAQLLGVAYHRNPQTLIDALQDPHFVHRDQRERAGGGHDHGRGDDEKTKQHFQPRCFGERRNRHVAGARQQHHGRLRFGERFAAPDGIPENIETEETDRGAETHQPQVQRQQRKEVPKLGEDVGPGGEIDSAKPFEIQPQCVEFYRWRCWQRGIYFH